MNSRHISLKSTLFCFVILFCFQGHTQFDFENEPDADTTYFNRMKEYGIPIPEFDSIDFQVRFSIFGDMLGIVIISHHRDSTWSYRRGYLGDNGNFRNIDLNNSPNLDSLWLVLNNNQVLTLPDQEEIIFEYTHNERTITLGPQNELTEKIIHSSFDGTGYLVQLISENKYRDYYYYNPILMNRNFQKSGKWSSSETELAANILTAIINEFEISKLFVQFLKSGRK